MALDNPDGSSNNRKVSRRAVNGLLLGLPLILTNVACSRRQSTPISAQPTEIPTLVSIVTTPSQTLDPALKRDSIKDPEVGASLLIGTLREDLRFIQGGNQDHETARLDELDKMLEQGKVSDLNIRTSYARPDVPGGKNSASVVLSSYSQVEGELIRIRLYEQDEQGLLKGLLSQAIEANLDLEKVLISVSNPNRQTSVTVETLDFVKHFHDSNNNFQSDGFHGLTGITPSVSLAELKRIMDLTHYDDPTRIGLELWIRDLDYDPINGKPEQVTITIQVLQ